MREQRSPFTVGLIGAAGVAVTYGMVQLFVSARDVLVLIGLALFFAIGLEPAVSWLGRRGLPRWGAVTAVCVALVGVLAGIIAAAVPPLVNQGVQFSERFPEILGSLHDHSSFLGQLNDRFQLQQRVEQLLSAQGSTMLDNLLGAGKAALSAAASTLVVTILTVYFLADLPRIQRTIYRFVPRSKRPQAERIGDAITVKVGGFVLGNVITSLIAATVFFIWLQIFGVPYPLLLAILAALLDLVPTIGSAIAMIVVSLVALSVSLPVAIATLAFLLVYRGIEDYILVPKIIGKTVQVPALVTMVAVLLGGVLLGVIGAIVAIPAAAVLELLLREVVFPKLEEH